MVKIFPNPNKGKFRIQDFKINSIESISVFDLKGNHILNIKDVTTDSIDISHLQKGVYALTIQARSIVKTVRVIIEQMFCNSMSISVLLPN